MKISHHLTLLALLPDRWRGNIVGLWRCRCGQEKKLPMSRVKSGNAKSCGCLRTKHGCASKPRTTEYVAWQAMFVRCRAKTGRNYEIYAARGITVCERWNEFSAFLSDMGKKPSTKHSLDRINNARGYAPENCRWATAAQQQQNRKDSLLWDIKGKIFPSSREAGKHFGVDAHTIRYWVRERGDCHVVSKY